MHPPQKEIWQKEEITIMEMYMERHKKGQESKKKASPTPLDFARPNKSQPQSAKEASQSPEKSKISHQAKLLPETRSLSRDQQHQAMLPQIDKKIRGQDQLQVPSQNPVADQSTDRGQKKYSDQSSSAASPQEQLTIDDKIWASLMELAPAFQNCQTERQLVQDSEKIQPENKSEGVTPFPDITPSEKQRADDKTNLAELLKELLDYYTNLEIKRISKDTQKENYSYRNVSELIDDTKKLMKPEKRVNLYNEYLLQISEKFENEIEKIIKSKVHIDKIETLIREKNNLEESFKENAQKLSSSDVRRLIIGSNRYKQEKDIAERKLWTSLQLLDDLCKQVLEIRRDNQQKTLEVMKKQETSFSAIQEMNPELAKMLKGIDDLFKPLTCYGKILECKERIQKLEKLQELAEKDPDVKAYLSLRGLNEMQSIQNLHKRVSISYRQSVQNFIYLSDEMNCRYPTKETIGYSLTNSKKALEGYEKDRELAEKAHGGITLDEKNFTEVMNNCKEFLEQYEARVKSLKKEYTDWLRNFEDTHQKLADLDKFNSTADEAIGATHILRVSLGELVGASDKVRAYFVGTPYTHSYPFLGSKTLQGRISRLYECDTDSHRQQTKWYSDQQKKLTEEIKDLESRISQLSPSWKKELGQHEMALKGQNKIVNDKERIKAIADRMTEEWYNGLFGKPE